MDSRIKDKLALFSANTQTAKKEFPWQNALIKRLTALLYALENKTIDCDAIKQCHVLIKQNTGIFSTFRGNMALCIASFLSLSPNPQKMLDETLEVYSLLKGVRLRASDYLVVAAYQIASQARQGNHQSAVDRTRDFYDSMKAHHFFHTGQDDYIFAAMLGLSDLPVATGADRVEQIFNRLKGGFWDKNSVQALAQVLVLCGSDDAAVSRVLDLRAALRSRKIRMDKTYTLPTLGILTLLPAPLDEIVSSIDGAKQILRAEKGFSSFSITMQELLIFIAAIVTGVYAEDIKDGVLTATLSTSITNIIIAQQTAIITAAAASTAVASSS